METRENLFYEILNYLQSMKEFEDGFEALMDNTKIGLKFQRRSFIDKRLVDYLFRLLEKLFLDGEKWIRYWVYDLDFGKNWEPGTVIDNNGTDVVLQTPQQLHDFLQKKMIIRSKMSLAEVDLRIHNNKE